MNTEAAKKYSDRSFWQRDEGKRMIADLKVRSDSRVLDVGCGTGELTAILAANAREVIAFDPDASRIQLAKESVTRTNIKWQEASIANFTWQEKYFDYCYSNFVLHWLSVPQQHEAVRKIKGLLVPEGQLAFTVSACMPRIVEAITRTIGRDADLVLNKLCFPPIENWVETLKKAGFEIIQADRFVLDIIYGPIENFYEWWAGTTHGVFNLEKVPASDLVALKRMFPNDLIVESPQIRVFARA
jgi:trans-aconitate 2-methyltransferase